MNTREIVEQIKKMAADQEQLEMLRQNRASILSAVATIKKQIENIEHELGIYDGTPSMPRKNNSSDFYDKYYNALLDRMAKGEGVRVSDATHGFTVDVEEKARVIAAVYSRLQKDERVEKQGRTYYMKEICKALYVPSTQQQEVKQA